MQNITINTSLTIIQNYFTENSFWLHSVNGEQIRAVVTIFCSFKQTGLSYLEEKDNLWILLLQKKKVAQVVVKGTLNFWPYIQYLLPSPIASKRLVVY